MAQVVRIKSLLPKAGFYKLRSSGGPQTTKNGMIIGIPHK
jgi:hypothetical protein